MKRIIVFLALVWLLALPAAAETDVNTDPLWHETYEASGIGGLYGSLDRDLQVMLERWGLDPDHVFAGGSPDGGALLRTVGELFAASVSQPLTAAATAAGAVLVCAFAVALIAKGGMEPTVELFSGLSVAAIILPHVGYAVQKAASAFALTGDFMLAFIPLYAGILISLGRTATVSGTCSLVYGFAHGLAALAGAVFMPLLTAIFALATGQAVADDMRPADFLAAVKKAFTWLLGAVTAGFTALVSLSGAVGNAGDSASLRAAKFVVGNMVPVVGRTLADSMAALQGYLSLLKTGSGALGFAVVTILLLPVLIESALWRCVLRLLEYAAQILGVQGAARFARALGDGFGLLLAVTVCCAAAALVSMAVLLFVAG